jgi:hypothetical protein
VPQHVVGDAQDALELHEGALAGGELHDHVVAVRAVVYLVGQLPPAPVIHVPRLAAGALDDRAKTRDRVLDLLFVELGDDYEHDFVDVQVCLLWSGFGFSIGKKQGPMKFFEESTSATS